jgi:hypothetical protein
MISLQHNTWSVKLLGHLCVVLAGMIGFYYTLWIFVSPFLPETHNTFAKLFPDLKWAAIIPAALIVVGFVVIVSFFFYVGYKNSKMKKKT